MKLFIVTGEASGDMHAADVVRELRKLDPDLQAAGMGGDMLRREGVRIEHDIRDMGIVGLFNVLRQLPRLKRTFDRLVAKIIEMRPEAVLLVDYPDFNLRIARRCREAGIPVIYYISPQVWAWRRRRVHQIARDVSHMIVIFPFEKEFYESHSVPVTYAGHPIVEQLEAYRQPKTGIPDTPLKLALMPGSRRTEVASLLGPLAEAAMLIGSARETDAYVIKAPTIPRESVLEGLSHLANTIRIVEDDGREALAAADLALCSSGTATLECAVLGVPAVVVYRLSRLTHLLARRLVTLPHFSLVNIVAGKRVIPELLQDEVTPANIAREANAMLEPARYAETVRELGHVRGKLGEAGASKRAAEKIYTLMRGSATPPRTL